MLKYSVIVPAYSAMDTLPRCLAALQDQTVAREDYEIIVVDDGSPDRTADIAEKILADRDERVSGRVIRAPHGGPAQARNIGARAANGDVLAFTDADCEPVPDWLEQLTAALKDETVSGAKGVYRTRQKSLVARFVQQEYQDKYDRLATQATIDFIDTYSAAYRRDAFWSANGFNPDLIMDEDQELSFRLSSQGHRLIFVPQAIVYHQHVTSLWKYARRKYGIGYWKPLVLRRHPDKALHDSHTPQVVKIQIGLLASALLTTSVTVLDYAWALAADAFWLLLFVSMLPLLSKIGRRDPAVVVIAPFLISVRAFCLGLGLLRGFQRFTFRANSAV